MRSVGFVIGISAAVAVWHWQQPSLEPQAPVTAQLQAPQPDQPEQDREFGSDVGDYGAQTVRVPPPADWIVKPPPRVDAQAVPEPADEWLLITRPFSSETAATAFSAAVAQDTGLNLTVQNPRFREYQVAVRLGVGTTREQAVAALGSQYAWMQFD